MDATRTLGILAIGMALSGSLPDGGQVRAAEEEKGPFSAALDVLVANRYVWRGVLMTDGGVIQPSITIGAYGARINAWGNLDLTDYGAEEGGYGDHAGEFSEIDLTVDYTYVAGPVGLSAGLIQYSFPATTNATTNEVFAGLRLDTILEPTFKVYYDFDEVDGIYATAGLGQTLPVVGEGPVSAAIALSAQVGVASSGYVEDSFGPADEGAFVDLIVTVSIPIGLGRFVTVRPTAAYTALLDRSLRDSARHPDNFVVGIGVGVAF